MSPGPAEGCRGMEPASGIGPAARPGHPRQERMSATATSTAEEVTLTAITA